MKITFSAMLVLLVLTGGVSSSQTPPAKPSLTPTKLQSLQLQNLQKAVLVYQTQAQSLQAQLDLTNLRQSLAMQALTSTGETFVKENNWPEGTTFDQNTLTFTPPAHTSKQDTK